MLKLSKLYFEYEKINENFFDEKEKFLRLDLIKKAKVKLNEIEEIVKTSKF